MNNTNIIKLYVNRIISKKITIDNVPANIRTEVEAKVAEKLKNNN